MRKRISEQKRKLKYRNAQKRRRNKLKREKRRNQNNLHRNNFWINLNKKNLKKQKQNKLLKLLSGEYISLIDKDCKILKNKNFINSQNYISSNKKDFKLFYYSKEKINGYKKSKILINKIKKDYLEKVYIKFFEIIGVNKKVKGYKVYLGTKFLYLIKK